MFIPQMTQPSCEDKSAQGTRRTRELLATAPRRRRSSASIFAACVLSVTHVSHSLVTHSAMGADPDDLHGLSQVLELRDYACDMRLRDSLAQLAAAERDVETTTARSTARIEKALKAFEKNNTIETQLLLYEAKRQAIEGQHSALSAYQQRLRTTAGLLRDFAQHVSDALQDFTRHSQEATERHQLRSRQAVEARQRLADMARRMGSLLDGNASLSPDIKLAVVSLYANLKGFEASSASAAAESETIDADIQKLQQSCEALNRQSQTLKAAARSIDARLSYLKDAAQNERNSTARRLLLWRSSDLLKAIDDLKVLDIIQEFPEVVSSRSASVTSSDAPDTRIKQAVRFYRPEPAIHAVAGHSNRLGVSVRSRGSDNGVVVTGYIDGSPSTRCIDQYGRPWYLGEGEFVTSINDRQIRNARDFAEAVSASGREIDLTVISEGQTYELLGVLNGITHHETRFGAYVRSVGHSQGVEVTGTMRNSPSMRLLCQHGHEWTLDPGETITHVNGRRVHNEGCFRRAILVSPRGITLTVKCVHGNTHQLSGRLNY